MLGGIPQACRSPIAWRTLRLSHGQSWLQAWCTVCVLTQGLASVGSGGIRKARVPSLLMRSTSRSLQVRVLGRASARGGRRKAGGTGS